MKKFISSFCLQYLPVFEVNIQENQDHKINLYVEKSFNIYKIVANTKTLSDIGFNEKDLECLLFHEKGHYELKHLEKENVLFSNIVLAFLMFLIFISLFVFYLLVNMNILIVIAPLVLTFYLIFDSLKYLSELREAEMQADLYACIYCGKDNFISMLTKMDNFYEKNRYKNNILYLLETHPPITQRIKNIYSSSIY